MTRDVDDLNKSLNPSGKPVAIQQRESGVIMAAERFARFGTTGLVRLAWFGKLAV